MVKSKKIDIRLSKIELERIHNNAHAKGYSTISAYLRATVFENTFIVERKISEIQTDISKILRILEEK